VLATGLENFPRRPPPYDSLPDRLVSHTADHARLDVFADQRVVVIGAGQSAIESAVLAYEDGAHVRVIARRDRVHWLIRSAHLHGGSAILARTLYAPTDVGPAGLSWLVAAPAIVHRLPLAVRRGTIRRCLRPAASDWLLPRAEGVTFSCGRDVVKAHATAGGAARLELDDGTIVEADHVLLGTGFSPDITSVSILAADLRGAIRHHGGFPILGPGFETSVPRLHAIGALATHSFGPVMRFVSGTWSTAPALARHIPAGRRCAQAPSRPRSPSGETVTPNVARRAS
jgi:thioredoxin reductase